MADTPAGAEPEELPPGSAGILEVDPPARAGHLPTGWLRTSDRARIDEDGFLWVLGRTDDVIIRGGFKVDLGALEAAIARHPAVAEVACVGLPDERLGTVPAALVVPRDGVELSASDVREHARQLVAPYAVPTVVQFAAALPRTDTLKPHKAAIRARLLEG